MMLGLAFWQTVILVGRLGTGIGVTKTTILSIARHPPATAVTVTVYVVVVVGATVGVLPEGAAPEEADHANVKPALGTFVFKTVLALETQTYLSSPKLRGIVGEDIVSASAL